MGGNEHSLIHIVKKQHDLLMTIASYIAVSSDNKRRNYDVMSDIFKEQILTLKDQTDELYKGE